MAVMHECMDKELDEPPSCSEEPPGTSVSEEPPGTSITVLHSASRRSAIWRGVPDNDWNDWRWQLRHRLNTPEQLKHVIAMTPEEEAGVRAPCQRRGMSHN